MGFPGFCTWAFWNSQLVTTVIGALILSLIVAAMVGRMSHRWEMKRKRFDFQLQVFRRFEERSRDLGLRISSLFGLHKTSTTPSPESDTLEREIEAKKAELAVNNAKQAVMEASLHLTYLYAQIKAAFRDKTILEDFKQVTRDTVREAMKAFAEEAPESLPYEPLVLRRVCYTEIVKIKMIREMGTVAAKECDEIVKYLQDSITLGKLKELEG